MPLTVYTARLHRSLVDPDLLDVTRATADRLRKSGKPAPGEPFAPSWEILRPALDNLRGAASLRASGAVDDAADLEAGTWARYRSLYVAEMRASFREHHAAWAEVLERPRVVLACVCRAYELCHRGMLARIFVRLGAVDGGERA